jgi:hypothetical protein
MTEYWTWVQGVLFLVFLVLFYALEPDYLSIFNSPDLGFDPIG